MASSENLNFKESDKKTWHRHQDELYVVYLCHIHPLKPMRKIQKMQASLFFVCLKKFLEKVTKIIEVVFF